MARVASKRDRHRCEACQDRACRRASPRRSTGSAGPRHRVEASGRGGVECAWRGAATRTIGRGKVVACARPLRRPPLSASMSKWIAAAPARARAASLVAGGRRLPVGLRDARAPRIGLMQFDEIARGIVQEQLLEVRRRDVLEREIADAARDERLLGGAHVFDGECDVVRHRVLSRPLRVSRRRVAAQDVQLGAVRQVDPRSVDAGDLPARAVERQRQHVAIKVEHRVGLLGGDAESDVMQFHYFDGHDDFLVGRAKAAPSLRR
ncbi:hypothetical protein DM77_1634 [Burkholderia mallei]|nr:hypothetical protein DM77_1634 [Burkholderia mallei]